MCFEEHWLEATVAARTGKFRGCTIERFKSAKNLDGLLKVEHSLMKDG
jgi:hypothetical protein